MAPRNHIRCVAPRSSRCVGLCLAALLLLAGPTASAQPDDSRLRPIQAPTTPAQPPPPPPPVVDPDREPSYPSSPVGAFTLRAGQVGLRLEVGYPFVELAAALGLVTWRLQLEAGYRGLYGLTNGLYGGLKWAIVRSKSGKTGLALRMIGGYMDVRKDPANYDRYQAMTGGAFGFGEFSLRLSARMQTTGFLMGAGVRLTEWRGQPCTGQACDEEQNHLAQVLFVEAGVLVRLGYRTSYFVALGLDIFLDVEDWLPMLIRFRNGFAVDF